MTVLSMPRSATKGWTKHGENNGGIHSSLPMKPGRSKAL